MSSGASDRIDLPVVLFSADVGRVLGKTPCSALRGMKAGRYGRAGKDGRRWYVLRDDFLAALRGRVKEFGPQAINPAQKRYVDMLKE